MRYFSTSLEGCFGEVLARFRADPKLIDVIGDEWRELGFMNIGDVPADWRQRRTAVNARFPPEGPNERYPHGVQFLDIESIETREALRGDFAPLLAFYGHTDLDVALVRSQDRRMTRYISQWAYEAVDDADCPLYAGIRYLSRLNNDWECWAVFDNVDFEVTSRRPILSDDAVFKSVCALYSLTPY